MFMLGISPLLIAEWQFFCALGFFSVFACILFASIWMLFGLKLAWHRSRQNVWIDVYRFWVRIFALSLVVCMSASIPLLIQLGTLWPNLLMKIAGVAVPLLCLAILLAFVCRLIFLNVMLYWQNKIAAHWHTLSVLLSALGISVIFYLIISLQAWMGLPQGTVKTEGSMVVYDWLAVLFHHEIPWRLLLVFAGSSLSLGFMMMGVSAWQALYRPLNQAEQQSFNIGVALALYGFAFFLGIMLFQSELFFIAFENEGWRYLWRAVIALLCVMALQLALVCFYSMLKTRGVSRFPLLLQRGCAGMTFSGWLLIVFVGALSFFRNLPFIVQGQIALQEVFQNPGLPVLSVTSLIYLLVYMVVGAGFVMMIYRAARYGVVPVRKTIGGTA